MFYSSVDSHGGNGGTSSASYGSGFRGSPVEGVPGLGWCDAVMIAVSVGGFSVTITVYRGVRIYKLAWEWGAHGALFLLVCLGEQESSRILIIIGIG